MEKDEIRGYSARISQANSSELVVIIYELFMYSFGEAKDAYGAGMIEESVKYMRKAQECVAELRRSLNFKYEISYELERLYKYVNEKLALAITKRQLVDFESVENVMQKLGKSFAEIAKQDKSAPIMQNSQKVYAGLTYGKNSLNEVFFDKNQASRGFKA